MNIVLLAVANSRVVVFVSSFPAVTAVACSAPEVSSELDQPLAVLQKDLL